MRALEVSEKEFDAQLFNSKKGLATMLGWTLRYHVLRSKGSQPGFPDRVLIRDRVIFAELKTETGKPSEQQVRWLNGLAAAGAEAYLWRPSDLEIIGEILSREWTFRRFEDGPGLGIRSRDGDRWAMMLRPGSLWIAGEGRADGR